MAKTLSAYIDLRSPYSYVAVDAIRALERDFAVAVDWLPFTLDIAGAGAGAQGVEAARWRRKVKYLYMDVRRFAGPRGLVIKGPLKVFDPFVSAAGLLFAKRAGLLDFYLDRVYPAFFDRTLDIEDRAAIGAILAAGGADAAGFAAWLDGAARSELAAIHDAAEQAGVFGVPSFALDGELFWGQDRIGLLRQRLEQAGLRRG